MDCSQRDRFELISAFLDGETSPADSERVRQMLTEDPQARQLYQRLLSLQQGVQKLPKPEPSIAPDDLADRVFAAIDAREPQRQQQQLQKLKRGLQSLPKPEPSITADALAQKVFATVDERRRYRRAVWWGGGAIAASFLALLSVSGLISAPWGPASSEALLVSLHEPLYESLLSEAEEPATTDSDTRQP